MQKKPIGRKGAGPSSSRHWKPNSPRSRPITPSAPGQLLASKPYGPYLGQDQNGRPFLDQAKIKRAEHLDGKFALNTHDDSLTVADIALGYKGMWVIESCFRRMNTTGLPCGAAGTPQRRWEVRPMFHWITHRITAHVQLCVLALMIQRAAEIATEQIWRQIQTAPESIKAIPYRCEGRTMLQTSKIRPEARDLLKKRAMSTPQTILNVA